MGDASVARRVNPVSIGGLVPKNGLRQVAAEAQEHPRPSTSKVRPSYYWKSEHWLEGVQEVLGPALTDYWIKWAHAQPIVPQQRRKPNGQGKSHHKLKTPPKTAFPHLEG